MSTIGFELTKAGNSTKKIAVHQKATDITVFFMRTIKSYPLAHRRWSLTRTSIAMLLATWLATPAQGAFHLWQIREVYTDTCGSNQFIELFCPASSQTFLNGQQIHVSSGGTTHTFTLTSNVGDSLNHALLFGTANVTNNGSPKPDYVIPDNFVFSGGGTISFFGANSGAYTALPTDGALSRTWGAGDAANTPQNFGAQVGFITPPNYPPSISIANPADTTLFATPATVPVDMSTADCDGSVVSVQLLTNGVPAATSTVAPFGFTLTGLPAGSYLLRAVAEDNGSLSTTSAPIAIRVAERPVLTVSPGVSGPIRLQFTSAIGIDYVVERSTTLTDFAGVVTNSGTGGILQFDETNATESQRNYRVRLQ